MGWFCPVNDCPNHLVRYSKNEAKERFGFEMRCDVVLCSALLEWETPVPAAPVQGGVKAPKCVCWKLPVAKCPKHGKKVQENVVSVEAPTPIVDNIPPKVEVVQVISLPLGINLEYPPLKECDFSAPLREPICNAREGPSVTEEEQRLSLRALMKGWEVHDEAPKHERKVPLWRDVALKLYWKALLGEKQPLASFVRSRCSRWVLITTIRALSKTVPTSEAQKLKLKKQYCKLLTSFSTMVKRSKNGKALKKSKKEQPLRVARFTERALLMKEEHEAKIHCGGLYAHHKRCISDARKNEGSAATPISRKQIKVRRSPVINESASSHFTVEELAVKKNDSETPIVKAKKKIYKQPIDNVIVPEHILIAYARAERKHKVSFCTLVRALDENNLIRGNAWTLIEEAFVFAKKWGMFPLVYNKEWKESDDWCETQSDYLQEHARVLENVGFSTELNGPFSWTSDMAKNIIDYASTKVQESLDYLKNTSDKIAEGWASLVEKTVKNVLGILEAEFNKYLERFLSPVHKIVGVVKSIWSKIKEWCTQLMNKLDTVWLILGEAVIWSGCLLLAITGTYIVGCILAQAGIIDSAQKFVLMFLSMLTIWGVAWGMDHLPVVLKFLHDFVKSLFFKSDNDKKPPPSDGSTKPPPRSGTFQFTKLDVTEHGVVTMGNQRAIKILNIAHEPDDLNEMHHAVACGVYLTGRFVEWYERKFPNQRNKTRAAMAGKVVQANQEIEATDGSVGLATLINEEKEVDDFLVSAPEVPKHTPANAKGEESSGHFLNALYKAFSSSTLAPLEQLAKWGRTLDSIKKGKDAFWDLAAGTIDFFSMAYGKLSGAEEVFFSNMEALTAVDLPKWIEDSQEVIRSVNSFDVTSHAVLVKVERLLSKGNKVLFKLSGDRRRLSTHLITVVTRLIDELKKAHATCVRCGHFDGYREMPFWVYIWGGSHCGKSTLATHLSQVLAQHNEWSEDSIYTKSSVDEYWSGYMRQRQVIIDDLSSVKKDNMPLEQQLITLVSTCDVRLNMAAVEDKGMHFNSEVIISSSNVRTNPTQAQILDDTAYQNRRALVLHVKRIDENAAFDPSNPLANTHVAIEDRNTGAQIQDYMPIAALEDVVLNAWDDHHVKEKTMHAAITGSRVRRDPTLKSLNNVLRRTAMAIGFMPEGDMDAVGVPEEWCYMAVDGVLYGLSMKGEATKLEYVETERTREFVKKVEEYSRNDLSKWFLGEGQVFFDPAGMVAARLHELVVETSYVESVDRIRSNDSTSEDYFYAQPLMERVLLRIWQLNLDEIAHNDIFVNKDSVISKIISSCRTGFDYLWKNSKILLIVLGIVLLLFSCYHFVSTIIGLFTGGATAGTVIDVLSGTSANSVDTIHRRSGNKFASRHVPGTFKRSRGNADISIATSSREGECSHLIVGIQGPLGIFVSGIIFKNRSILLTRHQAQRIADGTPLKLTYFAKGGKAKTIHHTWNSKNIVEFPQSEIVRYRCPSLSPLPRNYSVHFIDDYEGKLRDNFDVVVTVFRPYPSTEDSGVSNMGPALYSWSTRAQVMKEKHVVTLDSTNYYRELPKYIYAWSPGADMDCGGVGVTQIDGQWVVVGMHVAGNTNYSILNLIPHVPETEANSFEYVPFGGPIQEEGISEIGFLPPERTPAPPSKTQFHEVPQDIQPPVTLNVTKEPSILVSTDIRYADKAAAGLTPVLEGVKKFEKPMLDVDERALKEVMDEMADVYFDALGDIELEDVSLEVALNGEECGLECMAKATSEGWPYVLDREHGEKGKSRYLIPHPSIADWVCLRPDTKVYEDYLKVKEISKEQVPELVCIECPKDELLKPGKKTRLFSILPFPMNILLREKFLDFMRFVQHSRDTLSCQVGINPYSLEWNHLYGRLASLNSKGYNCDYSKFDGLLSFQMIDAISDFINRLYSRKEEDISKIQRKNMLMSIYRRKSIGIKEGGDIFRGGKRRAGAWVFEIAAGMPSGFALTVIINSLFNEILMRLAFKQIVPAIERPTFESVVELVVYGDDNLFVVHPGYQGLFTGEAVRQYLKSLRITITDGIDKESPVLLPRPLEELNFLKRGFKKNAQGFVTGPLDESSLYPCLKWNSGKSGTDYDILFQNVDNTLRELYLHESDQHHPKFDSLRAFYTKKDIFSRRNGKVLPTWNICARWHEGQKFLGISRGAASVDIIMQPGLKRLALDQGDLDAIFEISHPLYIAGPAYVPNDSTDYVVSMTHKPLKCKGCFVAPKFGYGYGDLPTSAWVKQFGKGFQEAREAFKGGKRVVFQGNPPLISAFLALTSFGLSENHWDIAHYAQAFHYARPGKELIEFYFDETTRANFLDPKGTEGVSIPCYTNCDERTIHLANLSRIFEVDQVSVPLRGGDGLRGYDWSPKGLHILWVFTVNGAMYQEVPNVEEGNHVECFCKVYLNCGTDCPSHICTRKVEYISNGTANVGKWYAYGGIADERKDVLIPFWKPLNTVWKNRCVSCAAYFKGPISSVLNADRKKIYVAPHKKKSK